jgi:hypothetical protein
MHELGTPCFLVLIKQRGSEAQQVRHFIMSLAELFVDASRHSGPWNGSLGWPYRTLDQAKKHIIREHSTRPPLAARRRNATMTVWLASGTYGALQLDHEALSGVSWRGIAGGAAPAVLSGGIEVPASRFKQWAGMKGVYVASLDGLGIDDLGSMVSSGNCVDDCQHGDKVGLSFGGTLMTLARWPNVDRAANGSWRWAHAWVDPTAEPSGRFAVNLTQVPDAVRMLRWPSEARPFLHGYWEWDWGDCYAKLTGVRRSATADAMLEVTYQGAPGCKPWARWMGVNLLAELDAPGEFYIDVTGDGGLLYFYPPEPLVDGAWPSGATAVITYQRGAVVNISSAVAGASLVDLEVRDGREAGVVAVGVRGLTIERLRVHAHGTHGVVVSGARDSSIRQVNVSDVGCSGIRATGGDAQSLERGNVSVEGCRVERVARWKRSYMPGIYFGGVGNRYVGNDVRWSPHNCMHGGGDFGDAVDVLVANNTLSDCTYETADSGGFYTCGQRGSAFTNRGNELRGNTFSRVRNTRGMGVQIASNQAVYLDDQMSGWLVAGNAFIDCQVGAFVGGGRRNAIVNNSFTRVGTVQYLNDQGDGFDASTVHCTEEAPPFSTTCSTGAARWMATKASAWREWRLRWPEMVNISTDHSGPPYRTSVRGNTYCDCGALLNVPAAQARKWLVEVEGNVETSDCKRTKPTGRASDVEAGAWSHVSPETHTEV